MVAVCLCTHEPRADLLAAQLGSLRAQSETGWRALVDDDASSEAGWNAVRADLGGDARFDVRRCADRAGPYGAFGRLYARVGADVEWVAPCDQDDVWTADHLAVLLAAARDARADVALAFGDARVVRDDGTVLSGTYWTTRDEFHDDLSDLLATNTVTGAASLVRRDVLDVALPFPAELDGSFHDHWLAVCALALGELADVDRALVDYVQHDANVVGWSPRRRPGERSRGEPQAARAARDRERHLERPRLWARTLLERAPHIAPRKRRALERAARAGLPWLAAGALAEQLRPRRTLEARRRALRGALLGRGRAARDR